jgi:hypothetical protein
MDDSGYLLLRGAIDGAILDAYAREREENLDGLLVRRRGGDQVELATGAGPDADAGAVDPYAIVPAARAALLPPTVTDALGEEPHLLFDAAETPAAVPADADGDTPYRDATHTALSDDPDTLRTLVVALALQQLTLWPGSHHVETTPFSDRYRHFNPERDGDDALARHRAELTSQLGDPETLTLAPGDAVLLHAGTVHRAPDGLALVAHLCPTRVTPGWFAYRPERARYAAVDEGRARLATQHYDLVDALAPETEPQPDELERVEEALREHDTELATDPPPAAPTAPTPAPSGPPPAAGRRSGGLVDSVRGILGRRGQR